MQVGAHLHIEIENHCPPNSPPIYCDSASESPPNATKTQRITAITLLYLLPKSPPEVSTAIGFPDFIELHSNSNTHFND